MPKIEQHTFKRLGYVAVGAPGVIYIGALPNFNGVAKIVVGSKSEPAMLNEKARAVAIDPVTGIVYADNESSISEYNSAGEQLASFGAGVISESRGVAVNAATGEVYVSNGATSNAKSSIDVFEEEFVPGAKISEEQATDVNQTAATLQAQISPNKSNTTYHFEYDTSPYPSEASQGTSLPSHGTSTQEVGIGSGNVPVPVNVRIEGLQPGTTYYYRVVARSEIELGKWEEFAERGEVLTTRALPGAASETCPNAGLRSEQPFGLTLPDCRAYELVSPLEKNDSGIQAKGGRVAVSGESFTYQSRGAFSGPKDNTLENRYLSRRDPDGWSNAGYFTAVHPLRDDRQGAVRTIVLHA